MEICKRISVFCGQYFSNRCPNKTSVLDDTVHKPEYVELDISTHGNLQSNGAKDCAKDDENLLNETRPTELTDISEQLELVVKSLEALEEKN